MNDKSDGQLLRDYAEHHDEEAFLEIVMRYTDFVYSTALRQVESADPAVDIAQNVFMDLARKATSLCERLAKEASLAGWLHRATRYAALNHLRDHRRRSKNERQAMNQLLTDAEPSADWEQIRPVLDEALDGLDDEDREAVLLRYFKNEDLRAVGRALGISDDAAQKRVSRAVERLREFFSRRNVNIGASGLAVLISANAVQAAPVGLAAAFSTAAVLAGTTVSTSTAIATTKVIAMTTLQKAVIGTALVATVGTGIYEARQAAQSRRQAEWLTQQVTQLKADNESLSNRVSEAGDSKKMSAEQMNELLKLRGQVTQSRNATEIENDPAFQKARLWIAKENELRQQFADHPDQWIPEMNYLSDEEWLDLARKADLDTATGMRCALSNVRVAAAFDFGNKMSEALHAYMNAHNQQPPDSTSQLSAYFHPPVDNVDAILSRYEMLNGEERVIPAYHGALIIQKTLVDHLEQAVLIGEQTISCAPPPHWPAVIPDELKPAMKAYNDTNQHGFLTIYDLEPYATTPAEKEALNKVIKEATTYAAVPTP